MSDSERQEFKSGAVRSKLSGRRDLIPQAAMDALGRRLELGTKYGENNWRKGGEDFRKATLNHLVQHLFDYMENGNANEANTDAIICNAAFLCHYEKESSFQGSGRKAEAVTRSEVRMEIDNAAADASVNGSMLFKESASELLPHVAAAMGWHYRYIPGDRGSYVEIYV